MAAVTGDRAVAAAIGDYDAMLIPRLVTAVVTSAEECATEMRRLVRKRSGKTARSITAEGRIMGTVVEAEVGPEWFVARFLEYGTPHHPPYPFVNPAADAVEARFHARIAAASIL